MTRSKSAKTKALVLLGIFATANSAMAALKHPPGQFWDVSTTGCQAYVATQCTWYAYNNGINLTSQWTCTFNTTTGLRTGMTINQNCVIGLNGGCCDNLDAGVCPVIACAGSD